LRARLQGRILRGLPWMEGGYTLDVAAMEDARTWKGELQAPLKGRIGDYRDGAMDGMVDALDAAAMGRHLECREERVRSAVLGCGREDGDRGYGRGEGNRERGHASADLADLRGMEEESRDGRTVRQNCLWTHTLKT
jgi:hypothetical protein